MIIHILSPDTPLEGQNMGGLGEYLINIIKYFSKDVEAYIIFPYKNSLPFDKDNIHFVPFDNYKFDYDFTSTSVYNDGISLTMLAQQFYTYESAKLPKPDIIMALDWSTASAAYIISRNTAAKLIFSVHLSIAHACNFFSSSDLNEAIENNPEIPIDIIKRELLKFTPPANFIACAIEMDTCQKADKIIHVSQSYMASEFDILGFPNFGYKQFEDKSVIVPNGIDSFEDVEKIPFVGANKYKLLYIGRLAQMKNILTLLDCELPENVDLIIVGGEKGCDRYVLQELKNKIKEKANACWLNLVNDENGNEAIKEIYGKESKQIIKSCDFMIVPSIYEPFGITALEALSAGKILLSSFNGGMKDFLNLNCAINCGTTAETITNAIDLAVNMSDLQKQKMINSGYEVCKNYTWDNTAYKLENVFKDVLKGGGSSD